MNLKIIGVVVAVIVVLAVVSLLYLPQFLSHSPSTVQPTSNVVSNGEISVTVLEAYNYTAVLGTKHHQWYFVVFNITDLNMRFFSVNSGIFYVSTNQGIYPGYTASNFTSFPSVPYRWLPSVTLQPGDYIAGGVVFYIPSGVVIKDIEVIYNNQVLLTLPMPSLTQISQLVVASSSPYVNIGKYPTLINSTQPITIPVSLKNYHQSLYIQVNNVEVRVNYGEASIQGIKTPITLTPGQETNFTITLIPPGESVDILANITLNISYPSLENYFETKVISVVNCSAVSENSIPTHQYAYLVTLNVTWNGNSSMAINSNDLIVVTNKGNISGSNMSAIAFPPVEYYLKPHTTQTIQFWVYQNVSIEKVVYCIDNKELGFVANINGEVTGAWSHIQIVDYNSTTYQLLSDFSIPLNEPDLDINIPNGIKSFVTVITFKNYGQSPVIIYNISRAVFSNQVLLSNGSVIWVSTPANVTTNITFPIVVMPNQMVYMAIYVTFPNNTISYNYLALVITFNDTIELS